MWNQSSKTTVNIKNLKQLVIGGRVASFPLHPEDLLFEDRITGTDVEESREDWAEWAAKIAIWALFLLEANRYVPELPDSPAYAFDIHTSRYINLRTGLSVPFALVESLADSRILESGRRLRELTDAFVVGPGSKDIAAWERGVIRELRRLHIQLAALGSGGWINVGTWDSVEEVLRSELEYLKGFAADIESGFMSDPQIRYRVSLYPKAAKLEFWSAVQAKHVYSGYTRERRIALGDSNTCTECASLAALGWQPIGTIPPPPQRCLGLNNCRCRMEFE